jgi:phosphoribosylformylglycinamidine synthase
VSDGGLACAVAECAIAGGVGARVDLDPLVELRGGSGETCLFGEGPGGFVVSGTTGSLRALEREGAQYGVDVLIVGEVSSPDGGEPGLELSAAEASLSLELVEAERAWSSLGARVAA